MSEVSEARERLAQAYTDVVIKALKGQALHLDEKQQEKLFEFFLHDVVN